MSCFQIAILVFLMIGVFAFLTALINEIQMTPEERGKARNRHYHRNFGIPRIP